MVKTFSFLTHIAIISAMFVFVSQLTSIVAKNIKTNNFTKHFIRSISVIVGLFIYIGARGSGLPVTSLILSGTELTTPITFSLFSLFLPFISGFFTTWYFLKIFQKDSEITYRLSIILMSFIIIMFGDVYVATYSRANSFYGYNKSLLPNLLFLMGVAIYFIFNYDTVKESK